MGNQGNASLSRARREPRANSQNFRVPATTRATTGTNQRPPWPSRPAPFARSLAARRPPAPPAEDPTRKSRRRQDGRVLPRAGPGAVPGAAAGEPPLRRLQLQVSVGPAAQGGPGARGGAGRGKACPLSTLGPPCMRLPRPGVRESPSFRPCRTYALRRVRDAFRENRSIKDPREIQNLVNRARQDLSVIRRQVGLGPPGLNPRLGIAPRRFGASGRFWGAHPPGDAQDWILG